MKRLPRILILTPFRNEAHSVSHYISALRRLNYPSELIDVYWLENDSTDETLELLEETRKTLPHQILLESIKIIGGAKKRASGSYCKDIPPGIGRRKSWLTIWNEYFLPKIRGSNVNYVLVWYADAVPPTNVITEYLKVFLKHSNAGWVGGTIYRRYPCHKELRIPLNPQLIHSESPIETSYTSHIWMMRRENAAKGAFHYIPLSAKGKSGDIHMSLILSLKKQGLKVYYQPSVFLKHVSTDGVIYTHHVREEDLTRSIKWSDTLESLY